LIMFITLMFNVIIFMKRLVVYKIDKHQVYLQCIRTTGTTNPNFTLYYASYQFLS